MKLFNLTQTKSTISPTIRLVRKDWRITGSRVPRSCIIQREGGWGLRNMAAKAARFSLKTVRSDQESRLNRDFSKKLFVAIQPPDSRNPRIASGNSTDTKSVSSATLCPFYRILGQPDLGVDSPRDYGCNLATEIGD